MALLRVIEERRRLDEWRGVENLSPLLIVAAAHGGCRQGARVERRVGTRSARGRTDRDAMRALLSALSATTTTSPRPSFLFSQT